MEAVGRRLGTGKGMEAGEECGDRGQEVEAGGSGSVVPSVILGAIRDGGSAGNQPGKRTGNWPLGLGTEI